MKINQDKVRDRLSGVPEKLRSHIYNAVMVIEFLDQNFVPTKKYLPPLYKVVPGIPIDDKEFTKHSREHRMKVSDLYDLYLRWRDVKDYTSEIESRYIFGIIIRYLRLYKNGWEFRTHRVGSGQVWFVGPINLTKDIPELGRRHIEPPSIERSNVEAPLLVPPAEEVTDEELDAALDSVRFKEARYFREAQYEPPEE